MKELVNLNHQFLHNQFKLFISMNVSINYRSKNECTSLRIY